LQLEKAASALRDKGYEFKVGWHTGEQVEAVIQSERHEGVRKFDDATRRRFDRSDGPHETVSGASGCNRLTRGVGGEGTALGDGAACARACRAARCRNAWSWVRWSRWRRQPTRGSMSTLVSIEEPNANGNHHRLAVKGCQIINVFRPDVYLAKNQEMYQRLLKDYEVPVDAPVIKVP
jgi:hypothetical protein